MKTRTFCLFLILCFCTSLIDARHILSGSMTYKCLGDEKYEMTLILYRDCNGGGAGFDNPIDIAIYKDQKSLGFVNGGAPFIESVEFEKSDDCDPNSPEICVERGTYVFDINLPLSDTTYSVVYQRCCWANSINNIDEPEARGISVLSEISFQGQSMCNQQEQLDFPLAFNACNETKVSIPLQPYDDEGDSLVYSLCMPLEGGGPFGSAEMPGDATACNGIFPWSMCPGPYESVPFAEGYSIDNPFPTEDGIFFDTVSNTLAFIPNAFGEYVFGLCITELRDGEIIATRRAALKLNNVDETMSNTEDKIVENEVSFYFDPISQVIKVRENFIGNTRSHLLDIHGHFLKTNSNENSAFDASDLPPGIYFVKWQSDNRSGVHKISVF